MNRLKKLMRDLEDIQGEIEKEIIRLNRVLGHSPAGQLQVDCKNGPGREQYYIKTTDQKRRYLSKKKDSQLIVKLGDKWYASIALQRLKKNVTAIKCFLKKATGDIGVYLADEFETRGVPTSEKTSLSKNEKIRRWKEKRRQDKIVDMEKNRAFYEKYKEWQVFETFGGDFVRSKSEGTIADILYVNNIPYVYETRLEFGEEQKYSDFVIYDPYLDREIYYEHFGRLDKEDYIQDTVRKIYLYLSRGFRLGVDFIFTVESQKSPLTTKKICEVLNEYITDAELKVAA